MRERGPRPGSRSETERRKDEHLPSRERLGDRRSPESGGWPEQGRRIGDERLLVTGQIKRLRHRGVDNVWLPPPRIEVGPAGLQTPAAAAHTMSSASSGVECAAQALPRRGLAVSRGNVVRADNVAPCIRREKVLSLVPLAATPRHWRASARGAQNPGVRPPPYCEASASACRRPGASRRSQIISMVSKSLSEACRGHSSPSGR